jgi:GNAT superfamily N-acetyltransferase
VRITVLTSTDVADCAAAHAVTDASRRHGRPWHESGSVAELTRSLQHRPPGDRLLVWLARRGAEPVGLASMWLPDDDNTDKAWLELDVHPGARRRGIGSALLETLVAAAAADGRSELVIGTRIPLSGPNAPAHEPEHEHERFVRRHGFTVQVHETMRHLRLPVPSELLERLDPAAGGGIPGYRVETVTGPIPAPLRASYCDVVNRLVVDAPSGEIDWEPETLTPAKLAACELADERIGRTRVTSLAVHEATGRVVAYTEIVAPGTTPRSVRQEGTLVHGEHRGHRLGLAVKVANLRALAQVAPARELITTGNADTNPWMIAINEQLGFHPAEAWLTCCRRLPDRGE